MVMVTHTIPQGTSPSSLAHGHRQVLIFSPDADLARTLVLNLEDKYAISRENTLALFTQALEKGQPDLIVVDLFTFSEDVMRLLNLLREKARNVPIITLRGYIPLRKDINVTIEEMSSSVFYKPVDVDLVSEAIENLLSATDAA